MKKLALHWKILIGMAAGVIFGVVAAQFGWKTFVVDWIKPFGTIFINLLKIIAIPLIIASLIKGVSDLKDISKLSAIGFRTLAMFIATTMFSISIGLIVVNLIQPGKLIDAGVRNELLANYAGDASSRIAAAAEQQARGPLQPLADLFPDNIIGAAGSNANMLQVIIFVTLFGIALVSAPEERARPVKAFFDSLNDVILKLIDIIMLTAPYGVFALLAALLVESPSISLFTALLGYSACVLIGLAILVLFFYPTLVRLFARRRRAFFLKGIAPAQLVAFSTSSSAATLPVTMECVEERLGVEEEVAGFVLPVGATVNMDGTSLYQAIAAVFIAQSMGLELSLATQLGIIVTATLASIGAAAVPGAGMITLVIVLAQAGIPEAGLALIFAVDRPLDMCRTIANVTGDATVAMAVAHSVGKLGEPKPAAEQG
ncbi:MAG: dicarboxylate/amino acid:cation symporter [Phaeodactylibacter sp.]|nr:dicarboxylate/amino acid:cation symporter [Phaeodactylibacter sp.]MCB9275012.1 dicarboxylate/amino acid:cation symporter [Lewinellaceae bacterium]